MRSLASIKTVSEIFPIEGKDRIVLAMIDGWSVIVKKGEFNVGDKCVYIEIDSVLPEREEFEFLRKGGFRIKTMNMAGVISQGICFPLSILPEKKDGEYETGEYVLPDTVNEVLDYAHGESMLGSTLREGIVFRSKDGKQSFKAVDPLFLLKYDE